MISDLEILGTRVTHPSEALPLVPCETSLGLHGEQGAGFLQPVADVMEYLKQRRPVMYLEQEQALFIALPAPVRDEADALQRACKFVLSLVKARLKVEPACKRALMTFHRAADEFCWKLKTFRAKYDRWVKERDWLVLVNRAKAGPLWQEGESAGLPNAFLDFVADRFAAFKRADGKLQALESIKRQWRTGLNHHGEAEIIPGYSLGWESRNKEILPVGWHYSNVLRLIKARAKFTKAAQKLIQEGTSAAKEVLPQVLGTRSELRFLEEVTFDDVRTDWLVFDTKTGQPCELWLLVARDSATRMVLGFVMHLSRAREDGSDSHLGLQEMKQLAGWLLERYPLAPYTCVWKVERGTATLSKGSKAALEELLPRFSDGTARIRVSYTSMIGGKSPVGYREKKKGNSKGKASHESHNRLLHTQGSFLPGQTGAHYGIRPADLKARGEECVEIWEMRNTLPEHLRGQEKYSLLTESQAREYLFRFCIEQNFRTEHRIEGFAEVLEWYDPASGKWQPQATAPYPLPEGAQLRKRMERPVERAIRLMAGHKFDRVSPEIIAAWYQHTARPVIIEENGEIKFRIEGRDVIFAPPVAKIFARQKAVGYAHPDDPKFLHVTDGRGAILGTWLQRNRVAMGDEEALAEALRYTDAAQKAAMAQAEKLLTPERDQLAAMRAHNAELAQWNEFIEVTEAPEAVADRPLQNPVAAALNQITEERAQTRASRQRAAEAAANVLLSTPHETPDETDSSAADDFLTLISKPLTTEQGND